MQQEHINAMDQKAWEIFQAEHRKMRVLKKSRTTLNASSQDKLNYKASKSAFFEQMNDVLEQMKQDRFQEEEKIPVLRNAPEVLRRIEENRDIDVTKRFLFSTKNPFDASCDGIKHLVSRKEQLRH